MNNNRIFFTITGMNYRYGTGFLKRKDPVVLIKEPDNLYDREAIRVETDGLGTIGYVANSISTVRGESFSAGRLYDRIADRAWGKVEYVLDGCALGSLIPGQKKNGKPADGLITERIFADRSKEGLRLWEN